MEQTMTVGELRDMLEGLDDSGEVRFVSRNGRSPMEYSLASAQTVGGVTYLVEDDVYGYMPGGVEQDIAW